MKKELKLTVNGESHELMVEPNALLIDVLNRELGWTGPKMGCDCGSCGACTVILDGKAVASCMILALQVNGKQVTTIEGIAEGERLHPIQQAVIDHGAVQCGYCLPGQIMSAKALLDENPDPTEEEVRKALRGNLCRCTGYVKMVEAVMAAKDKMKAGR